MTFPGSLAFYPVMGYAATTVFQLVPLCAFTLALGTTARRMGHGVVIRIGMAAVSLIEPVYQVLFMAGDSPLWALVVVGIHVYLINLVQLAVFRRFDFLSMYLFRISYYLLWHVVWGHVRLSLLF